MSESKEGVQIYVSCQLKFCLAVTCQLKFRPFVSSLLSVC